MFETKSLVGLDNHYAGFWVRLLASLIDSIILILIMWPIEAWLKMFLFPKLEIPEASFELYVDWLTVAFYLPYNILFVSSKYMATPGKMTLSLIVVNEDGSRISFGKALGRYFASFISYLVFFIGFIMIAFTKKKQGLHDMICKTYVIKKY